MQIKPADVVSVQLKDKEIINVTEYEITSDLYEAEDSFSITLGEYEIEPTRGELAVIYINGKRELTGVVENIARGFSSAGLMLSISGRSIMSFLTTNHVKKGFSTNKLTLKQIADKLLVDIRKIEGFGALFKNVTYQDGADNLDKDPKDKRQIEAGSSIFEVLDETAKRRGLMLFDTPDGGLVFGKPKAAGEAVFKIQNSREGCDVISGEYSEDVSGLYNDFLIITQTDSDKPEKVNARGTFEAPSETLPFKRQYVLSIDEDEKTPKEKARAIFEAQQSEAFKLSYSIPSHAQNGTNYRINELIDVEDSILNTAGTFLIYGRTFSRSVGGGAVTSLNLGLKGVRV